MVTKLIVFGLLCSTIVQALSTLLMEINKSNNADDEIDFHPLPSAADGSLLDLVPEHKLKNCSEKLDWYKQTTDKLKGFYDLYYLSIRNLKFNPIQIHDIEAKHEKFENIVRKSLEKYEEDKKKFFSVSEGSFTAAVCAKEINWFKLMDHNLVGIATNMKNDVSKVLELAGVSKEKRASIDETLSRIVNFLMIIDMTKNTFKDLGHLMIELNKKTTKTVDGIKPEDHKEVDSIDIDYGIDALDTDLEMNEEDILSEKIKDLADKTEIKQAELDAKERSDRNEKETEDEIENKERETLEREPVYEFVPRV